MYTYLWICTHTHILRNARAGSLKQNSFLYICTYTCNHTYMYIVYNICVYIYIYVYIFCVLCCTICRYPNPHVNSTTCKILKKSSIFRKEHKKKKKERKRKPHVPHLVWWQRQYRMSATCTCLRHLSTVESTSYLGICWQFVATYVLLLGSFSCIVLRSKWINWIRWLSFKNTKDHKYFKHCLDTPEFSIISLKCYK